MILADLPGKVDDLHASLVVAVGMSPERAWKATLEEALRYVKKAEQLQATQALFLSGLLLAPFAGKGKANEMRHVVEEALKPVGHVLSIRERFGKRFAEMYEQRIEEAKKYVEQASQRRKANGDADKQD